MHDPPPEWRRAGGGRPLWTGASNPDPRDPRGPRARCEINPNPSVRDIPSRQTVAHRMAPRSHTSERGASGALLTLLPDSYRGATRPTDGCELFAVRGGRAGAAQRGDGGLRDGVDRGRPAALTERAERARQVQVRPARGGQRQRRTRVRRPTAHRPWPWRPRRTWRRH